MASKVNFSKEGSKNLINGVKKVYDIIKMTIGPMGDSALISPNLIITNDGMTIARALNLANDFENIGARLVTRLATEVQEEVGDGTKTAIILFANLVFGTEKYLNRGYSREELISAFDAVQSLINQYFESQSQPITDAAILENVATIASGCNQVGANILLALENNHVPLNTQYILNSGYLSYQMLNNRINEQANFQNVDVVLINDNHNLLQIFNQTENPLLVIFQQYTSDDISLINKFLAHSEKNVVAIAIPDNENINALANFCNFENINGHLTGHVDEVIVTNNKTILFHNQNQSLNTSAIDYLQILKGYHAAYHAARSGVILGGGIGLVNLQKHLYAQELFDYQNIARNIISDALLSPYRLILDNGNINREAIKPYDFIMKKFVAVEEYFVYDSLKVMQTALNKAISYLPIFINRHILINN